jgi:hypothetical protein
MKKFNITLQVVISQSSSDPDSKCKEVKLYFYTGEERYEGEFDEVVRFTGNNEFDEEDLQNSLKKLGVLIGTKLRLSKASFEDIKITSPRFHTFFETRKEETSSIECREISIRHMGILHEAIHQGVWENKQ